MNEIHSDDYHDYVFQNGRLVGEFEQMYRKSKNVPWHQDKDAERLDCRLTLEILATIRDPGNILEVGCGLGYFADLLANRLSTTAITGVDVSATAIDQARGRFPALNFEVMDIAKPLPPFPAYDLVVIRGCFWYLFQNLALVVDNLTALTKPGGYILVAQNFPDLERPFIGKEIIPNPDSLVARFEDAFQTITRCDLDDHQTAGGNDLWLIYLGRRNQ